MGRFVFKLPDVGEGTAEAELVGWHVKVGDVVSEDQIVADVMTDKATVEITAPVSGKVTALHGEPGAMVPVRGPLVEFEVEGAGNAEAEAPAAPAVSTPSAPPPAQEAPSAAPMSSAAPEPAPAAAGTYVFKLPDVGEGTAEAELVAWHVQVGDNVEEDQILADVMTDKATVEITSPVAGRVVALHGEAGKASPVGGPLVTFAVKGAGNVAAASVQAAPPTQAQDQAPAPVPLVAPDLKAGVSSPLMGGSTRAAGEGGKSAPALTGRTAGERPLASPAVRNRARDLGVDLVFVPGTGAAGRIALTEAAAGYRRIEDFLGHFDDLELGEWTQGFEDAMNDDIAVPKALAEIHTTVRAGNKALAAGDEAEARTLAGQVRAMAHVLGFDPLEWEDGAQASGADAALDALVQVELERRTQARADKDFATADAVRDRLAAAGITITDTPDGPTWSLAQR